MTTVNNIPFISTDLFDTCFLFFWQNVPPRRDTRFKDRKGEKPGVGILRELEDRSYNAPCFRVGFELAQNSMRNISLSTEAEKINRSKINILQRNRKTSINPFRNSESFRMNINNVAIKIQTIRLPSDTWSYSSAQETVAKVIQQDASLLAHLFWPACQHLANQLLKKTNFWFVKGPGSV